MQTTLLGMGIAIILALVAALVGPYFVDWSDYRALFEARASQVAGVPVRVSGPIDARLLPVPSVRLRAVEAGEPSRPPLLKARELDIELALGPLFRGEWRATEMRIVRPELALGLDRAGRLAWRTGGAGIDLDAFAIERLSIEDGRLTLSDAATDTQLVLDKFSFNGDVRSLAGPIKGEGGFLAQGENRAYRVAAGRMGEDGGMRLRFAVDAAARRLGGEIDGILRFEGGAPQFDGALSFSRSPGVVLTRGRAVAAEPWRLTGRVKLSAANALFEQLELNYGPEERALKVSGTATLKLGERPQLEATVSARQFDLDRFVALPEPARRSPLVVLRTAAEALGDVLQPAIPVRVGVAVDTLTVADALMQTVRGDFSADAAGWRIEKLEFRAPGLTQVRASGRLTDTSREHSFAGPVTIDSADPRVLMAWLEGRTAAGLPQTGPARASGDLTIGLERIAVQRFKAELDRKAIAGSLDYTWASQTQRPRLSAELSAGELDLDAAAALIRTAVPGADLDFPAELALSLDIGRATFAGIEAKDAKAKVKLDASGLALERVTIGDLAGASIALSGRVEGPWIAPRGALTLDVAGDRLDGMLTLLEKVAPRAAELLRPISQRLSPAKLRLALSLDPGAAAATTTGKIRLNGTAGIARVALSAETTGASTAWTDAPLRAEGHLDVDDGRALADLFGLQRGAAIGKGPGSLRFIASGPAGGELAVQGRFAAVGLELTANGTLQAVGELAPAGRAEISATVADAVLLRPALGRPGQTLPLTFQGRADFHDDRLALTGLNVKTKETTLGGRLALTLGRPLRFDGRIEADSVNASVLLAALAGMPSSSPAVSWSADPFEPPLLTGMTGELEIAAGRAALTPSLEIRQLQGRLRAKENEAILEDIQGVLGGGRFQANVSLQSGSEGANAAARLALTGGDVAALMPGGARSPVTGRVSFQIEAKGNGRSPSAVLGALGGAGTVSFERLEFAGLDPRVFDGVVRAVDQAVSIDAAKVKTVVDSALNQGPLRVARADGALTVTGGHMRLGSTIARGDRADLSVSANVDLVQGTLDARLALLGTTAATEPVAGRPEINIAVKGPIADAKRTTDVSGLVGWLTLRAFDLQAKRLDAAEAERRAAEEALRRAAEAAARRKAEEEAKRAVEAAARRAAEDEARRAAEAAARTASTPAPDLPTASVPQATAPAETPPVAPPLLPTRRQPPPAVVEQAPALPPPIDIRPAPGSRRPSAQRSRDEETRRPPADVPRRSVFDSFFRPER